MALFLSFSCFLRPLPVFASFLALWRDVRTLLPVSSFCGGSFAGFARRLRSARLASTRAVVCVGLLAQKSLAETFRLPPHHFRLHVRMLRAEVSVYPQGSIATAPSVAYVRKKR